MKPEEALPVTLSGVRDGDVQSVMALIAKCGLHTEDLSPEKLKHFLVARKDAEIIGVAGIEVSGHNGLVHSLAVLEKFRGRGIAARLLRSIEAFACASGVEKLYLLTLTAEPYFRKFGYMPIDRESAPAGIQAIQEFQSLCPESAVLFHKPAKKQVG